MGKRSKESISLLKSMDVYEWAARCIFLTAHSRKCPKLLSSLVDQGKEFNAKCEGYIGNATNIELMIQLQIDRFTTILSKPIAQLDKSQNKEELSILVADLPALTTEISKAKQHLQSTLTALYRKRFPQFGALAELFELRKGGCIVYPKGYEEPIAETIRDLKRGHYYTDE